MRYHIVFLTLSVLVVILFGGCASHAKYNGLAKEHDFDHFFPGSVQNLSFNSMDEAYDFIKTAQAKFNSVVGKPLAKGVPGKLGGPVSFWDEPVKVFCFLEASNPHYINLAAANEPLEKIIRNSISATLVFTVFHEGRAISLANYYLQSGWKYDTANQHKYFVCSGIRFGAEYPLMWSNEKAFQYLRKEID